MDGTHLELQPRSRRDNNSSSRHLVSWSIEVLSNISASFAAPLAVLTPIVTASSQLFADVANIIIAMILIDFVFLNKL